MEILSLSKGGRSLDAIWHLPFRTNEKIILQYICSQIDFDRDFFDFVEISKKDIALKTDLSLRTTKTVLRSLEVNGYLRSYRNEDKAYFFALESRIFVEYEKYLRK